MLLLYLDDSGKTDPNHNSKFVVYGGIAVSDAEWSNLTRRLTGAKVKFFPMRAAGRPNKWELKAADFLTRNAWQRKKNRDFCYELVRILRRSNCSVYVAAAEKAKVLDETWLVPLMYQRIVGKFLYEVTHRGESTGTLVCDWTSYKLDHHISSCVGSYAISRGYSQIIGGVTYGSSHSFAALQAADLIAGAFRRWHEGATYLEPVINRLSVLHYERSGVRDVEGFQMNSIFRVF